MDGTLKFVNYHWGRNLNSNNATQTHSIFVNLFRNAKGKSMVIILKIIKDHGPKNPPPGYNLEGLFPSPVIIFSKEIS